MEFAAPDGGCCTAVGCAAGVDDVDDCDESVLLVVPLESVVVPLSAGAALVDGAVVSVAVGVGVGVAVTVGS